MTSVISRPNYFLLPYVHCWSLLQKNLIFPAKRTYHSNFRQDTTKKRFFRGDFLFVGENAMHVLDPFSFRSSHGVGKLITCKELLVICGQTSFALKIVLKWKVSKIPNTSGVPGWYGTIQARRQDVAAGGPKTRSGATFLKYNIGCMQQPVGQTWNGGAPIPNGAPGTTGPPAGYGPVPIHPVCRLSGAFLWNNSGNIPFVSEIRKNHWSTGF